MVLDVGKGVWRLVRVFLLGFVFLILSASIAVHFSYPWRWVVFLFFIVHSILFLAYYWRSLGQGFGYEFQRLIPEGKKEIIVQGKKEFDAGVVKREVREWLSSKSFGYGEGTALRQPDFLVNGVAVLVQGKSVNSGRVVKKVLKKLGSYGEVVVFTDFEGKWLLERKLGERKGLRIIEWRGKGVLDKAFGA